MRVIIVGAGGHAQVVADILGCRPSQEPHLLAIGYVDDDPKLAGLRLLDVPVFGPISSLQSVPHDAIIVAVGDNRRRRDLFIELEREGEHIMAARHVNAVIARSVHIGSGAVLCAGAIVNAAAYIGCNVIVNTGATVDHHCRISSHVHIAPGVHLGGEVEIGEGSLVGIGATVLPGVTIGRDSIVGAGAVVTRDLPDGVVAVGVPARVTTTRVSKVSAGHAIVRLRDDSLRSAT